MDNHTIINAHRLYDALDDSGDYPKPLLSPGMRRNLWLMLAFLAGMFARWWL